MKSDEHKHCLPSAKITRVFSFEVKPDTETRAALAEELGILGIKKLTFVGEIGPDGRKDLALSAQLGATVSQTCTVTLDPVTTRIDEHIARRFVANYELPEDSEAEIPEDDSIEPLPDEIDLSVIMAEALALNLPPWPRAPGIKPVDIAVTEPGKAPMTDDDAKPFAALKALKDKLEDKDGE